MQLLFSPTSYKNCLYLIDKQVDAILVGSHSFAVRNMNNLSLAQIKELVNKRGQTKIIVSVNSFFFDEDLARLTSHLIELSELDIEYVMFSDYAVAQIVFENNLPLKLFYNPETIVTSYGQFDFFVENKIDAVFLARELFYGELMQIGMNNHQNLKLVFQGQGLGFIMHSRWNLLSNFDGYLKNQEIYKDLLEDKDFINIREDLRKHPNILKQDEFGTHMFTGFEICSINILDKLLKLKMDYLLIDGYLHHDDDFLVIIDSYLLAMDALKNNTYTNDLKDELWNKIKSVAINRHISNNFLGTIKDILHMEKFDDEK
ncbi:U32 family peptidase [Ureaplasma canigenitalium]|uniref:U32 family peptidase n=1 Tax=Ureaplasma canigenitalium TaxID=42092 RepID=UPI00068C9038|nr:U32 family peptidase [Ureaplasma canigenitalium]